MLIGVFMGIPLLLLLVPVTVFTLQVFAAKVHTLKPSVFKEVVDLSPDAADILRPRLAVMVPAHNEAAGIAKVLRIILSQLRAGDRLLVVADNCSDATADVARACGAEVVERASASLRGKGFALDCGLKHLMADPPEVLAIVDADCTLDAGALQRLAVACARSRRPVQGLYLMHAPIDSPLRLRVAAFAWRVKNWLRPLGASRLGIPCPLMGTGMAFPWGLISTMSLATGHLVEDMKLGLELARKGSPPLFVPEARVNSIFPLTPEAAQAQRVRWEHGHLSMLLAEGPGLFVKGVRTRDFRLSAMALDLMVPPLTLLLGLLALCVLVAAVFSPVLSALPMWVTGGYLGLMTAAVARAWWVMGRDLLSAVDLMCAPVLALGKFPVYVKFVTDRQKEWVRTERHDDKP